MASSKLTIASIVCLAIWVAVWVLFLFIRFSGVDIRLIPGIGIFMLSTLVVSFLAPVAATGLAVIALIRQPSVLLNWFCLLGGVTVMFGQALVFVSSRWL
ncbi:MAG TPA: hypothetical protein VHZ99_11480 [Steroidobacteraceae bacterium]|jgi:hypothetical protein|nr:hypothetical protein [Steroidobacteraceae bacterium]